MKGVLNLVSVGPGFSDLIVPARRSGVAGQRCDRGL